MKRSLLLYLFIISLLFNVFTYMYFNRKSDFEKANSTTVDKNAGNSVNDSLAKVAAQLSDANYFSLENNLNAQDYFASDNSPNAMDYEKVIPYVTGKLLDLNKDPKGNPYTGQEQLGAKKFIINKAKVLNHRWIIADYSDGEYWGDVLLKYFINEDQTVSFEVIQSVIYQKAKFE